MATALRPALQKYHWGKLKGDGVVGQLVNDPCVPVDAPCAELWIGAHPSAPSTTVECGTSLIDFIASRSNYSSEYGNMLLPFLLKVLSVRMPLSLQCHPDAATARRLFSSKQGLGDPHAKPEVAIALSEKFHAMCGFEKVANIEAAIKAVPELKSLLTAEDLITMLSPDVPNSRKLEISFRSFLADGGAHEAAMKSLTTRTQKMIADGELPLTLDDVGLEDSKLTKQMRLFAHLHSQFPGDSGCMAAFLLEYKILIPGECIFIGPNILHAYVLGDCIEAMASSDNVIRGGLTPKHKDFKLLSEILEFREGGALPLAFEETPGTPGSYRPPVTEFQVLVLKEGSSWTQESPTAGVLIDGSATFMWEEKDGTKRLKLKAGDAFIVPSNLNMTVEQSDGKIFAVTGGVGG